MLLEKLGICMQKTEIRSMSFSLYQIQLKVVKDLNIRPKTWKLLQEKVSNALALIGIGNNFLNRNPVAQQLRERIDKWDYMK
jgi:hypothetical protein